MIAGPDSGSWTPSRLAGNNRNVNDSDSQSNSGPLRTLLSRLSMPADDWAQGDGARRPGVLPLLMWALAMLIGLSIALVVRQVLSPAGAAPEAIALLVMLVLALAIVAVLIHQVRSYLLGPLSQLYTWALTMCSGDLSARLPDRQRGHFAKLTFHINRLSEALDRLVNDMDDVVLGQTSRLQEKNESLEMLYELTATINETRTLDEMLTRVSEKLMHKLDASAAVVRVRAEDGGMSLVKRIGHLQGWTEGGGEPEFEGHSLSEIDSHVRGVNEAGDNPPADQEDYASIVTIPLRYRDRQLGVLSLYMSDPQTVENTESAKLLVNVGKHLGMAIAKSRLDDESRRLSLMQARTALAHELHDSLAQTLAGLRFQVRMLDDTLSDTHIKGVPGEMKRIRATLDEAHTELRELIAHFRAPVDERGLIPALRDLVSKLRRDSSIDIYLQPDFDDFDIPEASEVQVLRIVHEALVNVVKHSNAENARVLLNVEEEGQFRVLVEDDGCGIAPQPERGRPGEHIGLSIMRDRARSLGGTLTIDSEPGDGTRVLLTFPIRSGAPEQDAEPVLRRASNL